MMLSNYETYLKGNLDVWDGESKKEPKIKDENWYIYTCSELKFFADFVNGELTEEKDELEITENTTIYLMSNLDLGARQTDGELTEGKEWMPIGMNKDQSFKGIFEGNNHYIKGLYIKKESKFAGIFGYSTNTIQNLTIKDGYIENAGLCVGGIVGRGETIINCHNINTTVKQTAGSYVGGIVGQAKKIEDCSNTGKIYGNSYLDAEELNSSTGGITGVLTKSGEINKCKNYGTINSLGTRVGGIVGNANDSSSINLCFNNGKITGLGIVGGILGCASQRNQYSKSTVMNCYNNGEIEGTKQIGGIIGGFYGSLAEGKIKACYNIGMIEGNSKYGAIIGYNESATNTIEKCYYLEGSSSTAIGDTTDIDDEIDSMTNEKMTDNTLRDRLNTIDNSWKGNYGEYPKLKWE